MCRMLNYEDESTLSLRDSAPKDWRRRLTARAYDPFTIERDLARLIGLAMALLLVVALLRGCSRASRVAGLPSEESRQHQDG